MGSALLKGWLSSDVETTFTVIEPNELDIKDKRIKHYKDIASAKKDIASARIIILAIKPQMMTDLCGQITPHLQKTTPLLSIAAGITIENFEDYFGQDQPIIRSMPNTPAAIGKGVTAIIANSATSDEQKKMADDLLACAGKVEWIKDETLLDAITAISGSGPAYIFHLIEILTQAGENVGLPPQLSNALARQTVIGAAALAESEPKTPASTLRENVTSPGGTTAAALEILMNGEWQDIFNRAIKAAKDRSIELR